MASLHSVFRSHPFFSFSSSSSFFAGGKKGARLIINYLPALPRKAIAITSRSRGQGGLVSPPFLPPSLTPTLSAVRRFISYVHADEEQCENWGKCVTRLPALFIFARRNTPGRHALRSIPERSGLAGPRDEAVWLILYCGTQHWPAKPYVDCKKWDARKWQQNKTRISERGRKRKRQERGREVGGRKKLIYQKWNVRLGRDEVRLILHFGSRHWPIYRNYRLNVIVCRLWKCNVRPIAQSD